MDGLLPFFVPACCLWFSVTGAWMVFSTLRSGSGIAPAGEPTSESSAAVRAKVRTRLRNARIGGVFWLCFGIATVWFTEFRAPWILPSVGLFWAVIGAGALISTFRPSRQSAIAKKVHEELAAASNVNARGQLRRQQLAGGIFLLALGLPVLCFSGLRVGAAPAAVSQPPEQYSRVAEIVTRQVERELAKQGHVGLVVGAIAENEEALLGFGARRIGDSRPPDADTVFEIGSISKVFTGILLARRIENGDLALDDRVAELLPEGWTLPESARQITLQHCATHTSGIPRLPENLFSVSGVFRHLLGGDPYRDYGEEQFREALATVELEFEPGTSRLYSNFAVGLLGFVLATRNGTDYETLLTSEICRPLGMHGTAIASNERHLPTMAAMYRATLRAGPIMFGMVSDEWRIPNHLAGAGAIRSTGRDMITFLKANMGVDSTPIDAAIQRSHEELVQPHANRAGMNWIRSFDREILKTVVWHNGGTGGFSSYLGFTEDRQYGVFVLANTSGRVDELAEGILEALVREYAPGSRKAGHPLRSQVEPP